MYGILSSDVGVYILIKVSQHMVGSGELKWVQFSYYPLWPFTNVGASWDTDSNNGLQHHPRRGGQQRATSVFKNKWELLYSLYIAMLVSSGQKRQEVHCKLLL